MCRLVFLLIKHSIENLKTKNSNHLIRSQDALCGLYSATKLLPADSSDIEVKVVKECERRGMI